MALLAARRPRSQLNEMVRSHLSLLLGRLGGSGLRGGTVGRRGGRCMRVEFGRCVVGWPGRAAVAELPAVPGCAADGGPGRRLVPAAAVPPALPVAGDRTPLAASTRDVTGCG